MGAAQTVQGALRVQKRDTQTENDPEETNAQATEYVYGSAISTAAAR